MTKTMTALVKTDIDSAIKLFEKDFKDFYSSLDKKAEELKASLKNANQDSTRLDYYKWLDADYLRQTNEASKKLAVKFKAKNFTNMFVIGMGGSGINPLLIKNSLYEFSTSKKSNLNFIVQNNLDPSSMLARVHEIQASLDSTLFVIISKSGGTDEVRRNINILLDKWAETETQEEVLRKFTNNSVIITEPESSSKKNFLHELNNELEAKTGSRMEFLENDPNIGGRFSLFSPVGMFIVEMLGLDSEAMINASDKAFSDYLTGDDTVVQLAALDIYLSRNNFSSRYSMVYSDSLEVVNKFRAQLKGESLNKDSIDSTIHVPGIGTVNHHSDLELLLKKNNGVVLEQIFFAEPFAEHTNKVTLESMKDLANSSNYKSLIDNHINPLREYILSNGAPVIQRIIAKQDEASIAYFLMQDMLTTVIQAGLQDELGSTHKLDLAIRQHEVERYKKSLKK
jgi:glucose-6-phosphate isomerase